MSRLSGLLVKFYLNSGICGRNEGPDAAAGADFTTRDATQQPGGSAKAPAGLAQMASFTHAAFFFADLTHASTKATASRPSATVG